MGIFWQNHLHAIDSHSIIQLGDLGQRIISRSAEVWLFIGSWTQIRSLYVLVKPFFACCKLAIQHDLIISLTECLQNDERCRPLVGELIQWVVSIMMYFPTGWNPAPVLVDSLSMFTPSCTDSILLHPIPVGSGFQPSTKWPLVALGALHFLPSLPPTIPTHFLQGTSNAALEMRSSTWANQQGISCSMEINL